MVDDTASEGSSGGVGTPAWLFRGPRGCSVCVSGIKERALCFCLGVWGKTTEAPTSA